MWLFIFALSTLLADAAVYELVRFEVHFEETGWQKLLNIHRLNFENFEDTCSTMRAMLISADPLYHFAWVACDQQPLTLNVTSNTIVNMYLDAKILGVMSDSLECIQDIAQDMKDVLELKHKENKVSALQRIRGIPSVLRLYKFQFSASISVPRGMSFYNGARRQHILDVKSDILENWIRIAFEIKPRVVHYVGIESSVFSGLQANFDMYFTDDAQYITENWRHLIYKITRETDDRFFRPNDRLHIGKFFTMNPAEESQERYPDMKIITHRCASWSNLTVQDIIIEVQFAGSWKTHNLQSAYRRAIEIVPPELRTQFNIIDTGFGALTKYKEAVYELISTNISDDLITSLQSVLDTTWKGLLMGKSKLFGTIRNCFVSDIPMPINEMFTGVHLRFHESQAELPERFTEQYRAIEQCIKDVVRMTFQKRALSDPMEVRLNKIAVVDGGPMAYVVIVIDRINLTRFNRKHELYDLARSNKWENGACDNIVRFQFLDIFRGETSVRCDEEGPNPQVQQSQQLTGTQSHESTETTQNTSTLLETAVPLMIGQSSTKQSAIVNYTSQQSQQLTGTQSHNSTEATQSPSTLLETAVALTTGHSTAQSAIVNYTYVILMSSEMSGIKMPMFWSPLLANILFMLPLFV